MNTGVRITAYAAALAAAFGAAYGVGKGVGPVNAPASSEHAAHAAQAGVSSAAGGGHAGHEEGAAQGPAAGGLQISEGGYTLALDTRQVAPGPGELRFSVKDREGRKVTAFETEHGKELHFIVASRDLTVYRHLHPVRAEDGTWSTPVDLPSPGAYKVFADFTPAAADAKGVTLGADVSVPGPYAPAPLPPVAPTAEVDGYQVALAGAPVPGKAQELRLTVSKDGKPVVDLEPYLGAYGHLVALRDGDLAYLHVHPNAGGPGPDVSFTATAPSAGTYRLFLDFQHQGKVHTAAFTVRAGAQAAPEAPAAPATPAAPASPEASAAPAAPEVPETHSH
ncbi:hypothetical protein AB0N28_00065 [Streptomyces sp. NPDC051130]|uniref:hypothetical protein n=1 Tax=Streptomyces sp. NPDC051130 TaxID=3157223 RepID=UPI00344A29C8